MRLEELNQETNFAKYLKALKYFAERYSVIIASHDTPWGEAFSQEMTLALKRIGVKKDLYLKFRYAYAAIIDSGRVIYEKLSGKGDEAPFYRGLLGAHKIEVAGSGYYVKTYDSHILIDDCNYSMIGRGLTFLVFDKITGFILDSVSFDTYSPTFPCTRFKDRRDAMLSLRDKGITVVTCSLVHFPPENLNANEKFIIENEIGRLHLLNDPGNKRFALRNYYSADGVLEVLNTPDAYHDVNGMRRLKDIKGKYVNIVGGHRITSYQPRLHKHTIFVVGDCQIYGVGSDDSRTIQSYMQKILNQRFPELGYVVQNYGFFLSGLENSLDEIPIIIKNLPAVPGDIIIVKSDAAIDISHISMPDVENQPRDYELYFDNFHYTPDGNCLIAEKLIDGLVEQGLLFPKQQNISLTSTGNYGFDQGVSNELNEYKRILCEYYSERFPEPVIGSIVMNCNPFTLGHRYLIEQALKQCDFLIIFIVQEDKSIFPFEDRLKLVDECTADISNIEVIPSGNFIISSLTFSEYFNKTKMQDRIVDTSLDVTLFASEIAPCLHIKKRFAGEEPNDSVTRQYNETMSIILPEYGIEFIEIPRAKVNGETISASNVRMLLENRNFDKIKQFVPDPTYNYLINYSSHGVNNQ